MESREVAPGVFRLGNRFVNWWLITDGDGCTVVDAGLRKHFGQLDALLSDVGLDVHAIVLTHADIDHIGVAEKLRRDHNARVYLHPSEEAEAKGDPRPLPVEFAANMWRAWVRDGAAAYVKDGAPKPEFITELTDLDDGATLDVPGRPTVIHCPGHTPGSCAFHHADRSVLFTGDALVTVNPATGERGPQLMPGFDNDDHDQAIASLERLAETNAEVVLPGHGEPWLDGVESAVKLARAR